MSRPQAPTPGASQRREFLGSLATGAALFVGGGALSNPLSAREPDGDLSAAESPPADDSIAQPRRAWDMSWLDRLTGEHRQVFDAPEIADGTILHQARTWMAGFAEVYSTSDADTNAVLVIRHNAVPMAIGDAVWARMEYGKEHDLKDPTSGKPAERNPFTNVASDDRHSIVWPDGTLDRLIERGAIVLVCNLATLRVVRQVATKLKVPTDEARELVFNNMVPGTIHMPSGIFAVARAQEAGCHYIRAT
ncbi:MAG TPA: hypothetical protein VFG84_02275 [Gemmatimonadaceae bacterium]|nr:hypothetical protein [Gemmatimonadaceae bacterium]